MENKEKIENIYKEYAKRVYRYSMFKLNNKAEAEDVTSETFVRFIENKKNVEAEKLESWLIGIARNIIYEKYRKESKVINMEDDFEQTFPDTENADIDKEILTKEVIDEVQAELKNTNEDVREIIVLRIWEDMKFKNIAELMKMKEITVKQKYYRGLEQIKESLSKKKFNNKYYSFNLPLIVLGIDQIKNLSEYIIPGRLLIGLSATYGAKLILIFKSIIMTTTQNLPEAAGGILSSTAAKIVAALAGIGLIATASVGSYVVYDQYIDTDDNKPVVQDVHKVEEYKTLTDVGIQTSDQTWVKFETNQYSFNYPANWKVSTTGVGDFQKFLKEEKGCTVFIYDPANTNDVIAIGTNVSAEQSCWGGYGFYSNYSSRTALIQGKSTQVSISDWSHPTNTNWAKFKLETLSVKGVEAEFALFHKESKSAAVERVFDNLVNSFSSVNTSKLTKECASGSLNSYIKYGNGWTCTTEVNLLKLQSSKYTIEISDLGRGLPCEYDPSVDTSSCKAELFFENGIIGLNKYSEAGVTKEIFGGFMSGKKTKNGMVYITVSYVNQDTKNLTDSERQELTEVLNTIR